MPTNDENETAFTLPHMGYDRRQVPWFMAIVIQSMVLLVNAAFNTLSAPTLTISQKESS